MRTGLGYTSVVWLAATAMLAAQERYSLPAAQGGDAWRTVDPASVPPSLSGSPAQPLSAEPQVLPSEPAPLRSPSVLQWPPAVLPPASAPVYAHPPQPVPPPTIVYRPLIPLAPPPPQYYLGRGLFGQPKLYVPEQPVRNFLRYLSF